MHSTKMQLFGNALIIYFVANQCDIVSCKNEKMLPRLMLTEDYFECIGNKKTHCRALVKLQPQNETNGLWKKVLELETNHNLLDRTLLQRGLCIQEYYKLDEQCQQIINKEMEEYNFTAKLVNLACSNGEIQERGVDQFLLLGTVFLFLLITTATIMDKKLFKMKGKYAKILSKFSLISSWKQITSIDGNEDFKRLKSIQGIRIYNMLLILSLHNKIKLLWMYISNYEFLEQLFVDPFSQIITAVDAFLVQTFFMISAFLLTNQMYKLMERNKQVTLWDLFTIVVNRFFRLAPALAVLIIWFNSSYQKSFEGPHLIQIQQINQRACSNHWIASLLFFNNFEYLENSCNPVTWYLAADFQMYVMIAIMLYCIFKFKLNEWKTMGLLVMSSMVIYGASIYFLNLGIAFQFTIRNAEFLNFMHSYEFWANYSSTHSICTTSFIGMILGAVYYKTKNIRIKNTPAVTAIWLLCFSGFPIMAISIASKDYTGIAAALAGPLVKPLFALGIGIGILGMSHNLGGIVKKICELKCVVIMSSVTYCAYLCNVPTSLTGHMYTSSLLEITIMTITYDLAVDITKNFAAGIILTLAVEQPGLALQKMWLPQVKKCKLKDDK